MKYISHLGVSNLIDYIIDKQVETDKSTTQVYFLSDSSILFSKTTTLLYLISSVQLKKNIKHACCHSFQFYLSDYMIKQKKNYTSFLSAIVLRTDDVMINYGVCFLVNTKYSGYDKIRHYIHSSINYKANLVCYCQLVIWLVTSYNLQKKK